MQGNKSHTEFVQQFYQEDQISYTAGEPIDFRNDDGLNLTSFHHTNHTFYAGPLQVLPARPSVDNDIQKLKITNDGLSADLGRLRFEGDSFFGLLLRADPNIPDGLHPSAPPNA